MSTLLVLYVGSGLLLILVSLPLLWGKIPPNPIYGFRVRATLEIAAIKTSLRMTLKSDDESTGPD